MKPDVKSLRFSRLSGEFVQIEGIDGLSVAKNEQFMAFEIESDESRAAIVVESGLAISRVEAIQRDFTREILACDLIVRRVYGRVVAEKAMRPIAVFD
jgi:hypothetical protein